MGNAVVVCVIKRLPWGGDSMKVVMKDVAESCGVSIATVSKVLNGKDRSINEETRRKILDAVERMGYVQNSVAKGLRTQRTNMIGFILPDISNPFFSEIARGIEDYARQRNFGVLISNTNGDAEQEYENFKRLTSRMVDGVIFTRTMKLQYMDEYSSVGLPIVVVDREIDFRGSGMGAIMVNTQQGIYDATNILICRGCQKIAFISAYYTSNHDRFDSYCRALKEHGLPVLPELVFRRDYDISTGYDGMTRILESTGADGVICGNDLIAVGAYDAIQKKGLSVPKDIRVFGFDDIYFSQFISPRLTTVHQPAYEMGEEAARMLIHHIEGGEPLKVKELPYRIVMRDSV